MPARSSGSASGMSKLRSRLRTSSSSMDEASSSKEKEVQPLSNEAKALRDESKATSRQQLRHKQNALIHRAQERYRDNVLAEGHVLQAYARIAVKWFQKSTEGQTFDAKKVEKQIHHTLDVFSSFLKEWRMEYLMLPGTMPSLSPCISINAHVRSLRSMQRSSTWSVTSRCWAAYPTSTSLISFSRGTLVLHTNDASSKLLRLCCRRFSLAHNTEWFCRSSFGTTQ